MRFAQLNLNSKVESGVAGRPTGQGRRPRSGCVSRSDLRSISTVMLPEYLAELEKLETKYHEVPTGNIVFFGSSSIRLWPGLSRVFPGVIIENWGFGGSNLSDCAAAFARFIVPRAPSGLLVYAGDNDLARGALPADVWQSLQTLMDARDAQLNAVQTAVLSLKFAPARAELRAQIEETNVWCQREIWARSNAQWLDVAAPMLDADEQPRRELFAKDELHLSRAGYEVWNEVTRREVSWLG